MSEPAASDWDRDKRRRQRFRDLVLNDTITQQPGTRRMIRNASGSGNMIMIDTPKSPIQSIRSPTSSVSVVADFPMLPKSIPEHYVSSEMDVLASRSRMGQNLTAHLNTPEVSSRSIIGGLRAIIEPADNSISSSSSDVKKGSSRRDSVTAKSTYAHLEAYVKQYLPLLNEWASRNGLVFDIKNGWQSRHGKLASVRKTKAQLDDELANCKASIHPIYFDPNFRVYEPSFFQEKAEMKNTIILQEKLTNNIDMVELTILNHLSELSESFFEAMHTIQDLHFRVGYMLLMINQIRELFKEVHHELVITPLLITKSKRKHSNLSQVLRYLELMVAAQNAMQTIKVLISSGDYGYAIDLIEYTSKNLRTELSGIIAVSSYNASLSELKQLVQKIVVDDFASIAVSTLEQLDKSEFESRMQNLVVCASRLNALGLMGDAYHKALSDHVLISINRILCKLSGKPLDIETLPENRGQSEERKELVSFLKSISQSDLINLIKDIGSFGNEVMLKFERTKKLVFDVLEKNREALVSIGVSLDAALLEAINKQLQDMCGFVCENILGKMVDIMMVLPFESLCSSAWDVRKLIDCCMDLIDAGESSSKKTFYTVRSQLLSQVKSYLQVNHESGMQKLQSSLESEAWEEVSIPKKYQKLVDKGFITLMFGSNNSLNSPSAAEIVDKLSTPALSEFSALQKLNALKSFWWDSPELDNYSKNSVSSPLASHKKSDVSSEGAMYIIVDDEKFKLTSTMLKLFDYITFYIECAILLDYIAPDSLSRLVQFLSLYNSRSRQLILGVIGMQAASIKPQISSKQITMSSQCLGVLISAIPLLVKALKEKLPLKHHRSLQDFDRILKEISDHRDELFNKLRPPPPPPPPPSIPKK